MHPTRDVAMGRGPIPNNIFDTNTGSDNRQGISFTHDSTVTDFSQGVTEVQVMATEV